LPLVIAVLSITQKKNIAQRRPDALCA